jgi:hypothetical protein
MVELVRQRALADLRADGAFAETLSALTDWCDGFVASLVAPDARRGRGIGHREAALLSIDRANVEAGVRAAITIGNVPTALAVVSRLGSHWAMTNPRTNVGLVEEVLGSLQGDEPAQYVNAARLAAGQVAGRAHKPEVLEHLCVARDDARSLGHEGDALVAEYLLLRYTSGLVGSFDDSIERANAIGDPVLTGHLLEGKAQHGYLNGIAIAELLPWLWEAERIGRAVDAELLGTVLVNIANRLLDLDHTTDEVTSREVVEPFATEASQLAAKATSTFELCDLLLLDLRIEFRFGDTRAAYRSALAALQAMISRECTIAVAAAVLYAGTLARRDDRLAAPQHEHVRTLMATAAGYRNRRPGGSRVVNDNFPDFIGVVDYALTDDDVFDAAKHMIPVIAALL